MSEFKEVWYQMDDKTPTTKLVKAVRLGGEGDVSCYTLGEKRRRCVACKGDKTIKQIGTFGGNAITCCYLCNGTGWEYEK